MLSAITAAIWSGSWFFSSQIVSILKAKNMTYAFIFYITAALYLLGIFMYYLLILDYNKNKSKIDITFQNQDKKSGFDDLIIANGPGLEKHLPGLKISKGQLVGLHARQPLDLGLPLNSAGYILPKENDVTWIGSTHEKEFKFLDKIYKNGLENNTEGIEKINANQIKDIERPNDILLSQKFDNYSPKSFRLSDEEINSLMDEVSDGDKKDIEFAQKQIKTFAKAQLNTLTELEIETQPGVILRHKNNHVQALGCYVQAGKFPMVSSAHISVLTR